MSAVLFELALYRTLQNKNKSTACREAVGKTSYPILVRRLCGWLINNKILLRFQVRFVKEEEISITYL
jgi:hypothetical protein